MLPSILIALALLNPPAVHSASYEVKSVVQIVNGAPLESGTKTLDLLNRLEPGERLVPSALMEVDLEGGIYLNYDRVRLAGWQDVRAEVAFESDFGRLPKNNDELNEWKRDSGFEDRKKSSPLEKQRLWEEYKASPNRRHPGFRPTESRRPLAVKLDSSGNALEIRDTAFHPSTSALLDARPVSEAEVEWLRENVSLAEFSKNRERIKWRDAIGKVKGVDRVARIENAQLLGQDGTGNSIYLADVSMPFLRPHHHGTSDSALKVVVVSPKKKVIFSGLAHQWTRMHGPSKVIYEFYQGKYEGLTPALDDPGVTPWIVRVWRGK